MTDSTQVPTDVKYTADHEWARVGDGPDGRPIVRVGITDYAQSALGDVVYVQLPEVGQTVSAGEVLGEIESTKSVSDLFAPITGTVTGRNDAVEATPELANSDPYGAGWLVEIVVADGSAVEDLLGPEEYTGLLNSA